MKRVVRKNVWETNSSSVHSLSVSKKGLEKSELEPSKDGYIHVTMQYFGRELNYYYSQMDKLCYLLVCCCYMAGCVHDINNVNTLYEDYHFQAIQEAVRHYIEQWGRHDVLGIKVDHLELAELDHQSIPEYGEFPIDVNIWNEESIQDFIFNSYISLKTDCD